MGKKFIGGFIAGLAAMAFSATVFLLILPNNLSRSYMNGYEHGYKQGQIEALTGIIKYQKVTHEDETVSWEIIKEG